MLVKVNFYGVYRDFLDRPEIELDVDARATVRDMLVSLSEHLGEEFRNRVLGEDGVLQKHVNLAVNDRVVDVSEIDEPLSPDGSSRTHASVLFIPPMFGG